MNLSNVKKIGKYGIFNFPKEIKAAARRKLVVISIANTIQNLRNPPSNDLEKLKENRKRQYDMEKEKETLEQAIQ